MEQSATLLADNHLLAGLSGGRHVHRCRANHRDGVRQRVRGGGAQRSELVEGGGVAS